MTPRRRAWVRRIVRRTVGSVALAVVAIIVWAQEWGLPPFAAERVRAALIRSGANVDFELIRLDLPKAVKAYGVRVFDGPTDRRPRFQAYSLRFFIDWPALVRGRMPVARVDVRGGALLAGDLSGSAPAETIDRIRADIRPVDGGYAIENGAGAWRGLSLFAEGRIETEETEGKAGLSVAGQPARIRADAWRISPGLLPVDFPGGGELRARFRVRPRAGQTFALEITGKGEKTVAAGIPFRGWSLAARASRDEVVVESAELLLGAERVAVSGRWSAGAATVEARVSGAIPPEAIRAIPLGGPAERLRSGLKLQILDPLRFDVAIGPAPAASALERLRGNAGVSKSGILGVWFETLDIEFERDGNRLEIGRAEGVVGRAGLAGPLRLDAEADLDTKDYRVRMRTGFVPHALLPWMDPVQAMHVGAMAFPGPPPRIEAEIEGRLSDLSRLAIRGGFEAENMVYNGVFLASASARVAVSNRVLRIEEMLAERPDGSLRGRMEQDFKGRRIRFDADSSLPLPATARLCGPHPHRFISRFRAEGPSRIRARGQIDYGAQVDNEVEFSLDAESFGIGWCLTDRVTLEGTVRGRHVALTNVAGSIYGGNFSSAADFHLPDGPGVPTRYRVRGRVDGAELATLLLAIADHADHPQEGQVWIAGELAGNMGEGQGKSAAGAGLVRIRKGKLFDIPLFGGLSSHLAGLIPGVGFVSQGDLRAEVRVADGRVDTDRAELIGDLLSLSARGWYAFDRRLSFEVEAKLLRRGLIADIVRVITLPVTRLLSYDLTGTLTEPRWAPRNLPFGLFVDREEPEPDEPP